MRRRPSESKLKLAYRNYGGFTKHWPAIVKCRKSLSWIRWLLWSSPVNLLHTKLRPRGHLTEQRFTITLQLIGKIQRAHIEKEQLANDIEREEEGLTNNLLRKLSVLRSEKDVTDSEVEVLKKRLEKMRNEQEQVVDSSNLMNRFPPISHISYIFSDKTSSLSRLPEKLRPSKNYYRTTCSRSFRRRCRKNANWKVSCPDHCPHEIRRATA